MKKRLTTLGGCILSAFILLVALFLLLGCAQPQRAAPITAVVHPTSIPAVNPAAIPQDRAPSLTGTLTVCPTGPPTCDYGVIQEAVDAAAPADLIKIAAGIYNGVQAHPAPAAYPNAPPNGLITQVVFITETLTLQGGYTTTNWSAADPIAYPTIIDAAGAGRVFFLYGVTTPTLAGLTITGGDGTDLGGGELNMPWDAGGGVYVLSASITIRDSWVLTNTADNGGGIYLRESTSNLEGNQISGNSGEIGSGVSLLSSTVDIISNSVSYNQTRNYGGIYLEGSNAGIHGNRIISNTGSGIYSQRDSVITVTGNTFIANAFLGGQGGAVFLCEGLGILISNTFRQNQAAAGGALAVNCGGVAGIADNIFTENYATNEGGAEYIAGRGAVAVTGNTFVENSADNFAGALVWNGPTPFDTFSNNILEGNSARYGGGVVVWGGEISLRDNQILSNTAERVGGGILFGSNSAATLTNNILAENQTGDDAAGIYLGGSSAVISHTTLVHNHGGDGTGIYLVREPSYVSSITVVNSMLLSHTVGITVGVDNSAALEATLWGTGSWANETDWGGAGSITTGTINIWGDPDFVDPSAGDYHIGPQSAAIDAGLDAGVTIDIDGQLRPNGPAPDIGADEYVAPRLPVT